jgi:hypothetical protein
MASEEEFSDEEIEQAIVPARPGKAARIGITVMGHCDNPECERFGIKTPVASDPISENEYGTHQRMTCVVCGGSMNVYTTEDIGDLQANFDAPPNSEA